MISSTAWKNVLSLADWSDFLCNADCDFADFFWVKNQYTFDFAAYEVSDDFVCWVVCAVLEAHAVLF